MMTGGSESCPDPEDPGTPGIHENASAGLVVIGVGSGRVGWGVKLYSAEGDIDQELQLY
jgi:hypothetical protein